MTSTFTDKQQKEFRAAFIREANEKAWGAACHADWIGKQTDELMSQYTKLSDERTGYLAEIDKLANAIDSHTKDNRDKRKELQSRVDALAKSLESIGASANGAQKAMQQLYANVEQNLALAKHAETWEWKEVAPETASADAS